MRSTAMKSDQKFVRERNMYRIPASGACLNIYFPELHALLCCDVHLKESNFQTRSGRISGFNAGSLPRAFLGSTADQSFGFQKFPCHLGIFFSVDLHFIIHLLHFRFGNQPIQFFQHTF